MITKPDCYIFSVQSTSRTFGDNVLIHGSVKKFLTTIEAPFTVVTGHYKGIEEQSFLIVGQSHKDLVERLCKQYSQEAYLHIHSDNTAELVYTSFSKTEKVGKLVEVSESEATKLDNYTFVPNLNRFYTTK